MPENSPPSLRIWALLDERQGNTSQTLGVAEALGLPYETKTLTFNAGIKLPNFLLNFNRLGVSRETRAQLSPPWPDLVLSSARRLALVAAYIKTRQPHCFLAQVQWPGRPVGRFDLIATPLHDGIPEGGNVMTTLGAPHRVTRARLAQEAALWAPRLGSLRPPFLAVLVGGASRARAFGAPEAAKLGRQASQLAKKMGATLLVTTSRRTGDAAVAALRNHLTEPHHFYAWQPGDAADANPYFGYLGLADATIVTGDSVSMVSEACAAGKPVYVYGTPAMLSPKQQRFLEALYARGVARPLADDNVLFEHEFRFDDAQSVAAVIRKRLRLAVTVA